MSVEGFEAALVALASQPTAVALVVFLAGIHAAIWLRVLERIGLPPALASLVLVPPLTLLVPLYVALARWPVNRLNARRRGYRWRPVHTVVRRPKLAGVRRTELGSSRRNDFRPRTGLLLAADGLPMERIPLPLTAAPTEYLLAHRAHRQY